MEQLIGSCHKHYFNKQSCRAKTELPVPNLTRQGLSLGLAIIILIIARFYTALIVMLCLETYFLT